MKITVAIICITSIVSLIGFTNERFKLRLLSNPFRMWHYKEWYRLITSGFVHANMIHLILNMLTIYITGTITERVVSTYTLLTMYISAIAFSNLYKVFTERNNCRYRSLGASGGTTAILFYCILLQPINLALLAYVILFIVHSIYQAYKNKEDIDHAAHCSGAMFGIVTVLVQTA